ARQQQRALQLREILHFERERHPSLVLPRLRVDGGDVDLLARQQFRDVAQQTLPVAGLDDDVDGEDLLARRTPRRLDQQLRLARADAADIRTARTVDRDALAARDEAHDGVRRRGLAAAREAGQQP